MSAHLFSRLSLPSLESIDHQGFDTVCTKLMVALDEYRLANKEKSNNPEQNKAFSKMITGILRDRFKLDKMEFQIFEYDFVNAFAIPPEVTKKSIMTSTYGAWLSDAKDGRKTLDKNLNGAVGWVDRSRAVVGGFFCDLDCTVGITYGMMVNENFNVAELTAALLHEVGHIMTYLETLAFTFGTCFTLIDTVTRLQKSKSHEERVKIFKNLEDTAGVQVSNKDLVSDELDADTQAISIFSDIIESSKSEFGASIYDMRSWESLSDQFSARMGMTVHLATGLDKLNRLFGDSAYESGFTYWMGNILRWVLFIGLTVVHIGFSFFIILELLALLINPFKRVYDKPAERLIRLRQEIVIQMKRSDLAPRVRKDLKQDLDVLDNLIKNTNDKEGYEEKLWLIFSRNARDQKAKRLLLQDLQAIANNDLFASANLLKTLQ